MLSKIAGSSPKSKAECIGECPHVRYPSRNLLQKGFTTSATFAKSEFFICGNGPYILVSEFDLLEFDFGRIRMPFSYTEVAVFPLLQIPLKDGGQLCQSRVVSARGIIVGGRRLGANKVQVFYEDGCYETLEIVEKRRKHISIVQKGAKKVDLQGVKVTSLVVCGSEVLLGTSRGQVVSHLGKVYLRADEAKGAVRQMTVINEHILLLLFHNKAIALLDTSLHGLRSVIEGRFTAVESVFTERFIVAGDLDGTLHCFKISPKGTLIRLLNSSKCIFRDAIISMFPIQNASLVCATAMGSMFIVNRMGFVKSTTQCIRGVSLGSQIVKTKDRCYVINGKQLWNVDPTVIDGRAESEHPDLQFSRLRHYRLADFEMVFAFGDSHLFSEITYKNKQKKELLTFDKRITTAVATEEYLLLQFGREIRIYVLQKRSWKWIGQAVVGKGAKVSAFAKIQTAVNYTVFVVALQNGFVYFGNGDPTSTSPQKVYLISFASFPKDFVVSMQPKATRIYALTAKAKLHVYVLFPVDRNTHPDFRHNEFFHLEKTTSYKYPLGRGYDIIIFDEGIYLVGFKQKMLNIYKHNDQQILSTESKGPRSCYAIHEASKSSLQVVCDQAAGMAVRLASIIGRVKQTDMKHAAPISHILVMMEFPNDGCEVVADIVTGDCKGLVALMACTKGVSGSHLRTRLSHQLPGAIRAMNRNGHFLFVGSSTGTLGVFQYAKGNLYPVFNHTYPSAVTHIRCPAEGHAEGALIGLSNGWEDTIECPDDRRPEAKGKSKPEDLLEDIKWSWRSEFDKWVLSLSRDGILHLNATLLPQKELVRSSDIIPAQRYTFVKNVSIDEERQLTGLAAGYEDGMFLFVVYGMEGFGFFTADCLHHHEIIDAVFYKTTWSSSTTCTWSLGTLDKDGVYVQRTLICNDGGIKLHGLPMKWHFPVRHPKAMTLLEKKKEVLVVGEGVSTLALNSLAPPP